MKHIWSVFALTLIGLGLGSNNVRSAVLTWNGSISTDWNNATNWLPQQIPTASDHVVFNSGSLTAPTNSAFAILDWNGGNIYGALTVASGAVLNLGGSGTLNLYGALTNAGTVVVTNTGNLRLFYSPTSYYGAIYNLAGGLFDIQNDQFYLNNTYGTEFFNNAGTLRKSAGSGATVIYPIVNNTGTVDAETGTLSFRGGGTIDGQFHAAAGATMAFDTGSYTGGSAPQFTGAGAFKFNSGTLTLLNNLVPSLQMLGGTLILGPAFQQGGSITNLSLSGMSLTGTNTVTGAMNWTAGNIYGALTVAGGAVLNLGGSGTLNLYGALTNAGTVVVTNTGNLRLFYSPTSYYGAIYNLAGGLFDIQNDQFYLNNTYGTEFFNNAGTLRKSAGSGATVIYPIVNNTGTVDAETGTLSFRGGGTIDGQFHAAAGATMAFDTGSYTGGSAPQFTGAGAFKFNSGTLTLLNNLVPSLQMLGGTLILGPAFQQGGSITNLSLSGMSLTGTNTVTGAMNWTAGNIYGALTVAGGAVLNLGGSGTLNLYGALTNAGTVVVTNTGNLRLFYSPTSYYGAIYNLAGGLFDIQNDQFYLNNTYGTEFFNNAGTLRKSAGSGATVIYPIVNNTGTVDAETGTLSFRGGGTIDGQFHAAAGATMAFDTGSYTGGSAPQFTGAGAFKFNSGTLTLLNNLVPSLQMLGGTLILGPAFQQGGSITNLSLSGMSLTGTNTVTGAMNWTAGNIYGALTVAGGAVLNLGGSGTLNLYGALTNAGTVVVTNTGNLRLFYSPTTYYGAIYNLAGGLFDIQNDQFYLNNTYGTEFFNNAGTLRKSAGSGATQIYVIVNNTGLIEADAGTLGFQTIPNLLGGEVRFGLSSLTNFGKINILGNANLTGTVGIALLGGYVPITNNSFTVLGYGSHTGIFAGKDFPATLLWATNYTATTFTVTVASMNKLVFTTQPVGLKLTNVILAPVVVQVESPTSDPLATNGVPVTLSLASGGGLQGTLIQNTDASGKATFSNLKFSQTGFKTLRASSPSLTAVTSVSFKIVAVEEVQWTTNGLLLSLYGTNNLGSTTIYATTNLISAWIPIYTNPPTTNAIQFLDTASTNYRTRFYRTVEQ